MRGVLLFLFISLTALHGALSASPVVFIIRSNDDSGADEWSSKAWEIKSMLSQIDHHLRVQILEVSDLGELQLKPHLRNSEEIRGIVLLGHGSKRHFGFSSEGKRISANQLAESFFLLTQDLPLSHELFFYFSGCLMARKPWFGNRFNKNFLLRWHQLTAKESDNPRIISSIAHDSPTSGITRTLKPSSLQELLILLRLDWPFGQLPVNLAGRLVRHYSPALGTIIGLLVSIPFLSSTDGWSVVVVVPTILGFMFAADANKKAVVSVTSHKGRFGQTRMSAYSALQHAICALQFRRISKARGR